MLTDATRLPDNTTLEASVAIVGAGPAGIVIALELAKAGIEVLLIESGHLRYTEPIQQLSAATIDRPDHHPPMSECTRLQIGGASAIWGGRCLPYDPIDFDDRPWLPHAHWPIGFAELEPYFDQVGDYLHCGRPVFNLDHIPGITQTSIVPGLPDGDVLTSTLERWSLPTDFGRAYRRDLQKSDRITLVHGLTCTEIVTDGESNHVNSIAASTLEGGSITVKARHYIIAGGGLNTTRLLLNSDRHHPGGIGNHSGLLGRFYTGHLGGRIARVRFITPPRETRYSFDRDGDGTYLRRRFSFSREFLQQQQLPNTVGWLVNSLASDPAHGNGIMSFAYLALKSPLGKKLAPEAIRKAAIKGDNTGTVRAHVMNMVRDWWKTLLFVPTFGYQRYIARRKVPGFHLFNRANTYDLYYWCEQRPNPDSRVTLSDDRDALGMRRLNIDVQYFDADFKDIVRSHQAWDEYLQRAGCGRLEYFDDDPEARARSQPGDGFHQIGTTRMSVDPADGVVTSDCLVHGFDDLSIASSSTFVTAGQANSMYMILAFALRLAQRITTQVAAD